MDSTKRCRHGAEEILAAAIKCKHCKSDLMVHLTNEPDLPPHAESIVARITVRCDKMRRVIDNPIGEDCKFID
jgi:hypothetical protein